MKKGPPLQEGRYFFSCAVFQDPDSLFNKIVVAGGYNQSRVDTNSVEILDPFPDPTISNKWEYGKYKFPMWLWNFKIRIILDIEFTLKVRFWHLLMN